MNEQLNELTAMFGSDGAARVEAALEAVEYLTSDECAEFVKRVAQTIAERTDETECDCPNFRQCAHNGGCMKEKRGVGNE